MRTMDMNDLVEKMKVAGDEPILPAFEFNAVWRSAWLRAIARAWKDDDYRAKLLEAPTTGGTSDGTRTALGEAGLSFPEFFSKLIEIEIRPYQAKASDKTYEAHEQRNGWKHFDSDLRARLVITLPPKPAQQEDFALALADYDAGGRVYPFSFC